MLCICLIYVNSKSGLMMVVVENTMEVIKCCLQAMKLLLSQAKS